MVTNPEATESASRTGRSKHLRRLRRGLLVAAVVVLAGGGLYAYQRLVRLNFGVVVPGEVYRSAQPNARSLERWHEEHGIRTCVNLRGVGTRVIYGVELETNYRLGVRQVDIPMAAGRLPRDRELRRLIEIIETAERPILLHCAGGADRTGLASVVAAMAIGGADFETAREQFTFRHLHIDRPDRIDDVLDFYEAWCREQGLDTGGWERFRHWAMEVYEYEPPPKTAGD